MDGVALMAKRSKVWTVAALLIPILALASLAIWKQSVLMRGRTVKLPITGFDPRDLLAGNFLRYRVVYGVKNLCYESSSKPKEGYVCLKPPFFEYGYPHYVDVCPLFIKGKCQSGRFHSGLERFYIPVQYARPLEKAVISGDGAIRVAISSTGHAVVEELFIEDKPWKTFVDELQ